MISKEVLEGVRDGTKICWKGVSEWRFHLHWLKHDTAQRLTLIGLIVTVAGLIIDAGLTIGKVSSIWIVSKSTIIISMMSALVLKVIGLSLVFWKGVLRSYN